MTSSHQSWILRCRCLKIPLFLGKMKNLVEKVARARGCNHSCPCVWRLSGCVFLKIEAKQKKTWRPGNENMNFEPSKSSRSYHVRHIFLQETAVFLVGESWEFAQGLLKTGRKYQGCEENKKRRNMAWNWSFPLSLKSGQLDSHLLTYHCQESAGKGLLRKLQLYSYHQPKTNWMRNTLWWTNMAKKVAHFQ